MLGIFQSFFFDGLCFLLFSLLFLAMKFPLLLLLVCYFVLLFLGFWLCYFGFAFSGFCFFVVRRFLLPALLLAVCLCSFGLQLVFIVLFEAALFSVPFCFWCFSVDLLFLRVLLLHPSFSIFRSSVSGSWWACFCFSPVFAGGGHVLVVFFLFFFRWLLLL